MNYKQQRVTAFIEWFLKEEILRMIEPTIGRKVWFWKQEAYRNLDVEQPEDATVVYVHTSSVVNLRVTSHEGVTRFEERVFLVSSDSEEQYLADSDFAIWMPYQISQDRKHKL